MRKILIITGHYVPAYKDGGPIRTLINLVDFLGDEYEFKILTADREIGDETPFKDIKGGAWNKVGKAEVYYLPPHGFKVKTLYRFAKNADVIYVTGCYREYAQKIMLLRRINLIKKPVFLASMGMFSPRALEIKAAKKKIYFWLMSKLGMLKSVRWSVTSTIELNDLKRILKVPDNQIYIAEDLPRQIGTAPAHKDKGEILDVCFLSRISKEKNLLFAINVLNQVRAKVNFTIYGPIFDKSYWNKCKDRLNELPSNIKWSYAGNVESSFVVEKLKQHHVFLFPTMGENYGHVIFEALSAGCQCIISDQTPWKDLQENGVGYALPLDRKDLYVNCVEQYAMMTSDFFSAASERSYRYAERKYNEARKKTGYREIFDTK